MANIESKRVENMSTLETTLTGRIELVDLDKVAPVPVCFVRQLRHKFPPPHIADGFAQGWMLHHGFDRETLNADRLVFTDQTSREFVQKITAAISNAGRK